jgi:hypothetical protein
VVYFSQLDGVTYLQERRDLRWWRWFFWSLAALLGAGCSHALSPEVRQQIDTTLSLTQLRTNPEAYKDRIVMLGGEIVSTSNLTIASEDSVAAHLHCTRKLRRGAD